MYGGKGCTQGFGRKNLWAKYRLRNLGVDGRIVLKCIFKKWYRDMDSIDLGQDTER
jgi:hypothetical protein